MKNMTLLKIALVSLSFLSVSAFSIKLFEIHLHLGASASTQVASPLFKVEPNAKFSDHWDISVPNDGQWHDTGLVVPSNKEFISFSPITTGDNIEYTAIRIWHSRVPYQLNNEANYWVLHLDKAKQSSFTYCLEKFTGSSERHLPIKNLVRKYRLDRNSFKTITNIRASTKPHIDGHCFACGLFVPIFHFFKKVQLT